MASLAFGMIPSMRRDSRKRHGRGQESIAVPERPSLSEPQRTQRAALIVFEGPDEMGKSSLARSLVADLLTEGRSVLYKAFPGTETGTVGHLVYQLHHNSHSVGLARPIRPATQQMLHVAAHIEAIEQDILPRLKELASVVLDRFWWSTWAYGAAAGVAQKLLDKIVDIEIATWGPIVPDAVFLVRRDSAFGAETEILWQWYEHLAEREAPRYPIHLLRNDGALRDAVDRARANLPPFVIE